MSIGAFPGETATQRGKRRILVGGLVVVVFFRLITTADAFDRGLTAVVILEVVMTGVFLLALGVLHLKPGWVVVVFGAVFLSIVIEGIVESVVLGGLVSSSAAIVFGMIAVLGALIALSIRAAFWLMVTYLAAIVLAVALPNWIPPAHIVEVSSVEMAGAFMATTALSFAVIAYFVRQRNRLQQESDDLLHNILPDEISQRLKADEQMIADSFESASVLFADVVDFTPMSAGMSAPELVGLLNEVFSTFDRFVAELGLEKIKTVGDEYMVAAGVPQARSDHADAIAQLALRIRDHTEHVAFNGHSIRVRIGIASGPVVAGVIGTHKFSFDLWGVTVNTASRMESEGIPGSIQLTEQTHELIRDRFICEPRGVVFVKGMGDMNTYLLMSARPGMELR